MKNDTQICPLCNAVTTVSVRPRSYGQWLHYACTNVDCGPSEISTKARVRLRSGYRQAELRAVANSCRLSDAFLRVGFDGPSGEYRLELVARDDDRLPDDSQ